MNAIERTFPRTTAALGLLLLAAALLLPGCADSAALEQLPVAEDRSMTAGDDASSPEAAGETLEGELAERESELARREQSLARAEDRLEATVRRLEERADELEQRAATSPASAYEAAESVVRDPGGEVTGAGAAADAAGPPFPRRSSADVAGASIEPVTAADVAPAVPSFVTVPAGSLVEVELETALSSETSAVGDGVFARTSSDVLAEGAVAIPAGMLLTGRVVEVVRHKKVGGQARLTLVFDGTELDGDAGVELLASASLEGKKQSGKDAATIGGAAAGGAILGRVLKDKDRDKGTLVGAVLGAAVGTAIAATNPGDPVLLERGDVIELTLDAPLRVAAAAPGPGDLLAGR